MTGVATGRARSLWKILRWPLVIFAGSLIALAAALLGQGVWHWCAWLLLAVPLLVIARALMR